MAHPPSGRRRLAADERDHRLLHLRLDERCRILLSGAADLANARLSAQATLAISYFSMRNAEQQIRLFEASVAAFTRSLQIVQNQVDAGTASRLDLAQAQTQLEQTRAILIAANINRATFEHAVAVLVGKAPAEFSLEPGPPPLIDIKHRV